VRQVGSALAAAAAAAALLGAAGTASAATVTVTPADGHGWATPFDARLTASAFPVENLGPRAGTGAVGDASLQLLTGPGQVTADPSYGKGGRSLISYTPLANQPLSRLTSLSLKTFVPGSQVLRNNNLNAGINIPVDLDSTDGTDQLDTILVWEAYRSASPNPIAADTWQTWHLADGNTGWWSTKSLTPTLGTCSGSPTNPQNCLFSLAAFNAQYPNAKILGPGVEAPGSNTTAGQPYPGGLTLVTGSTSNGGWADFQGFVDGVSIELDGTTSTDFDFEQVPGTPQTVDASTFSQDGFAAVSDDGTTPVVGGNLTNQRGFASGPATPPSGSTGSYRMKLATLGAGQARSKENLYYTAAAGTTIGDLTDLSYATFASTTNAYDQTASVTIGVTDPAIAAARGGGSDYTGLVFDPTASGNQPTQAFQKGTWQHWSPFAPEALWRCTGASFHIGSLDCSNTLAGVVRWADIRRELGDAVVNADGIQFAIGSTGTGSGPDGNEVFLDDITVGTTAGAKTFGFEPGAPLQVCASGCMFTTPAQAVAAAQPGDEINIHAGTYPGGVLIDTPSLTITGAGADATQVTGANNAAAFLLGADSDGLTLEDLKVVAGGASGSASGIRANALGVDDVTLDGVTVSNARYGIDVPLAASADGWTIEDSTVTANNQGARFNGNTTDLVIDGSHFDGNDYGLYSQYRATSPRTPGVFDQVDVSDSTFDRNSTKGMYLEAVSNATFTRISANANGSVPEVRPSGPPPYPVAGVDINVKYGAFAHVSFIDSSVNDTVGTGMAIKGRNDAPSYSSIPGSLDDVLLQGMTISGSLGSGLPEAEGNGVAIGNNVTNARIVDSRIVGNVAGGVFGYTDDSDAVDADGNWWGCNAGPAAASCDSATGTVDASSWLQLRLAANPTVILAGTGTSQLTASLVNTGGNGAGTGATHFPATTVGFASTLGSVPASATTAGGAATATLTAGPTAGTADVTATLDSGTAHQDVTLTVVVPPTPPSGGGTSGGGGEPPANNEPSGTPPVNTNEPNTNPVPTQQETRDAAKSTLDGARPKQDRSFNLGPAEVFIPKAGPDHRTPSQTVPIVSGNTVRLNRNGVRKGNDQTLFALASPTGDSDATVTQTVKIGNKTYKLPVQEITIPAGSSEPVKLPLTKAMRNALKQGKQVVLTVTIKVVDEAGNTTTATKTYTLKAPKPHKKHTRGHR
jgi:hypothetical protein